ncbi:hypothetical protein ABC977_06950 [Thioalkalicoccus limnaeus]|uniref:UspA domain-containing protein n=1 Tax=Thioalkalicoccus limnaeus TaxID=120681 RepID=A0ABV4BCC3_9GAMM
MTKPMNPIAVRRVAVALDASPNSLQGLALAAGIAAALGAEIEGIFVEDSELLRLAGLPFLLEFRATTRGEGRLDSHRLEREFRAAARQMRTHLERCANELGLGWSFRTWRGDIEAEILGAALDAELFTLGRIGRFAPLHRQSKVSATARPREGLTVGVLVDASEGATRALGTAATIASRDTDHLVLILPPGDPPTTASLREQAFAQMGPLRDRTLILAPDHLDPATLAAIVSTSKIDLLVVDAANPMLETPSLWANLERLDCPVVIGR